MKVIYDLFGGSGAWSQFYRADPHYQVILVDPLGGDVKLTVQSFLRQIYDFPQAHGILAAPPCHNFSSAARAHWPYIPQEELEQSINNVRTALRIIRIMQPQWWCLENPVGRIERLVPELGARRMMFNPNEFAGYHNPDQNRYTKKTVLWGNFKRPKRKSLPPVGVNPIHVYRGPRNKRSANRAITPSGFARAFYGANE